MNVILEAIKAVVRYVEDQEYLMHTIVKNVHKWKKTEMVAQKLLI